MKNAVTANVPKLTNRAVSKLNPPQRHVGVMGDNEKSMLQHQIFISTQPLMTTLYLIRFATSSFWSTVIALTYRTIEREEWEMNVLR